MQCQRPMCTEQVFNLCWNAHVNYKRCPTEVEITQKYQYQMSKANVTEPGYQLETSAFNVPALLPTKLSSTTLVHPLPTVNYLSLGSSTSQVPQVMIALSWGSHPCKYDAHNVLLQPQQQPKWSQCGYGFSNRSLTNKCWETNWVQFSISIWWAEKIQLNLMD